MAEVYSDPAWDRAIAERDAEITRLRAGGCARDQSTTQYCAEAARLAAEVERLRAALKLFECDCEGDEFCYRREHCRNYIARAALKEPRTDSEAATRALDEYLREGGVALEDLKAELKEPRT